MSAKSGRSTAGRMTALQRRIVRDPDRSRPAARDPKANEHDHAAEQEWASAVKMVLSWNRSSRSTAIWKIMKEIARSERIVKEPRRPGAERTPSADLADDHHVLP